MPVNHPDPVLQQLGVSHEVLTARRLPRHAEANELEWVETGSDGRQYRLMPAAADAWRRMKAAAAGDGIDLILVSAFRSVARQVEIIEEKLAEGFTIRQILTAIAPPGYSEHHTGRAIDIATPDAPDLDVAFAHTPAYAWLARRAGEFGFTLSYPRGNPHGYQYEPWHWCFHADAQEGGRQHSV